ncbi:acetyl-CoA synthetase-like protein [Stereum hirsutum FP-91666 SS1]|uniref:acetyl-CoA synthetase-like protein n=1 Tax=Stereum hirsutum (strain FP-91666) TaxID=721885 RepID=UPI000440AAAA|nr:acetyl-CoA synthetase-like protein [Stereum hirsutum FP-91666 SS1]EIM91396.1 acetyl-CoA synthetase-like protein [Stereum hirsutum FP-91666 SS1]
MDVLAQNPQVPVFKRFIGSDEGISWTTVTWDDYKDDLIRAASVCRQVLADEGIKNGDVVGLWLTGHKYSDFVYIYAISAAGFVPQVFSSRYLAQGIAVIGDLLKACNGKALLVDAEYIDHTAGFSLPTRTLPGLSSGSKLPADVPTLPEVQNDDIAMIFHTSGTTGGKPKPIPETHRWIKNQCDVHWRTVGVWQGKFDGQDVINTLGNFAHVGTAMMINYLAPKHGCAIQTPRANFSAEELLAMIEHGGVNRLQLYAPWFSNLISIARRDPRVLNGLRGMRHIAYTGTALNPEDEAWIRTNDIPATNMYASTEAAPCLIANLSDRPRRHLLRVISDVQAQFIPTSSVNDSGTREESRQGDAGRKLFDLFFSDTAPNCPHPRVRNRADGFVTGDLFEEVEPGYYVFRGRNDDWIQTGRALTFCDTKSIEDNVFVTCADVVHNCTVVGNYKPFPVLFVEPVNETVTEDDIDALKKTIINLTAPYNARLFVDERIQDPSHIVVVPRESLSRTGEKGNVRRKIVEQDFKDVLDNIYTAARG